MTKTLAVGVLAIQGAFIEHIALLRKAASVVELDNSLEWKFLEVRTPLELQACDALIIPGGESTTVSLVAARSGLLDPLREFVKYDIISIDLSPSSYRPLIVDSCRVKRKPTWGTCAGLILLAESANRTKKGGQELIGGLDVRVYRNYFGRQTESFQAPLDLPFLRTAACMKDDHGGQPFDGIFIRAPVVEEVFPVMQGEQKRESLLDGRVIAPSKNGGDHGTCGQASRPVEIMATLPGRSRILRKRIETLELDDIGDIVAVRQANVFGTSFHPELTEDPRIHIWWLTQVRDANPSLSLD
ncbi:MAG: hypothetical protein Q9163_005675 [Psora crenata]